MDERSTKRHGPLTWLAGRSRRFWAVVVVLLLPVLHFASMGPVLQLFIRLGEPPWLSAAYNRVYAPFHWATDNGPPFLERATVIYLEWWLRPIGVGVHASVAHSGLPE